MSSYKAIIYVCLVATACALPTQEEARSSSNGFQTERDLLDTMYKDCLRKDSLACGKYKLFSVVDKMLGQKDTITVIDGVQIVKTEGGEPEGAPRALSADEGIQGLVLNRVARFLESHTIKIDLKGSEIVNTVTDTARSLEDVVDSFSEDEEPLVEEGRKKKFKLKKGGKKGFGALMGLAALKMAFLAKLALAGIALMAGKALIIAKIALVLSAIVGIKKLFSGKDGGKQVTYEVVAHPQHSSSHASSHESFGGSGYGGDAGFSGSSGHGGWERSLNAQTLAYKAQIPKQ